MNRAAFWKAIGGPYSTATANDLVERLQELPLDELYQFDMIWMAVRQTPNYYALVESACDIFASVNREDADDEGVSLEESEERAIKCWLIAQGEVVYNAVMANAHCLNRYVEAENFYQQINNDALVNIPKLALQKKTGTMDYHGRNPWRTSTYDYEKDEFINTSVLNAKKMGPHSPWVRKILRATNSSDEYGPAVGKILESFLKDNR